MALSTVLCQLIYQPNLSIVNCPQRDAYSTTVLCQLIQQPSTINQTHARTLYTTDTPSPGLGGILLEVGSRVSFEFC